MPRGVFRHVIENATAIVAANHFVAAPDFGHHLRPERHKAGRTGAVACFGDGDAIAAR